MSDWVTICDFSLQDDLSEVADFIRRHQLPMRISEERNRQCIASPVPQLVEPMRQLLQRWHAGEVDLAQISVHVYEQQAEHDMPEVSDTQISPDVSEQPAQADVTERGAGAAPAADAEGQPAPQVPSVIPNWPLSRTPLSLLLIALCFIGWFLLRQGWVESLVIFPQPQGGFDMARSSLAWHLAQGEYWRLWSPAMVHFSLPHALTNSLGIWIIGRSLEARAGTWMYALLVLISAPISNVAQYLWSPQVLFGGMSGVVYAMVGAAFVIQRWEPRWRDVPASIVWLAVIWLLVCMSGLVEFFFSIGIANAAHLGGFAAGLVLGLLYCAAGGARRFVPRVRDANASHRDF